MSTSHFVPTPPEAALVNQIFALFDLQKSGVLTGDVAVKAFAGAKLPPTILGEIWNIADEDNRGRLSRKGVAFAVRLIGWAQKGEKVSKDLLARPGPLATIDRIPILSQQNTGLSLSKSPPPTSLPPLTLQDRTKFHNLFHKAGPQHGLISGEKARGVFLKSKLSNDQLLQIWILADTQDRGALDITDFTIGMYFIQAVMSRQLSVIPLSLPPGLYQQAAAHPQTTPSQLSNSSGSFSPISSSFSQNKSLAVQPQYTGQNIVQPNYTGVSSTQKAPQSLVIRPAASSPFSSSPFGQPPARWDVTPTEKANADRFFDDLDVHKRGFIEGDVAVPFMLKSNLPGEDLAQIWDLADLDNNGRLTRDGFAVAMHLIQKRIAGQDIPDILLPSLVPPSMRNPASTQQLSPEPVNDLFIFDDAPAMPPQSTGSLAILQPQQTGPKLSTFAPPSIPPRAATIDPFSTSTFTHHQDLLGDDDEEPSSSPLHDKSAEIGNVQNQIKSTNRSLETAKNDRVSVEQTLSNQASQLSALQTQLSSAKAAYETETKLLATLKDRQTMQLTEIQKLREELIHAESNLSALRVEKAEIESNFLRDKEEARDLHRKMIDVGKDAEKLKQELEKIKKEAKQQKGLLAIARKQLSTKESERNRVEQEMEEATNELTSIVAEKENVETELAKDTEPAARPQRTLSPDSVAYAAQHSLPSSPDISLAGSIGRSNNPFEKLGPSSAVETNGTAQSSSPVDMFSFDKAFVTEEAPGPNLVEVQPASSTHGVAQITESTVATSKAQLVPLSPEPEDFFSPGPESEQFVTPPSSSSLRSQVTSSHPPSATIPDPASPSTQESHSIEDIESSSGASAAATHFPTIEDFGAQFVNSPDQEESGQNAETDLTTELKELDVNDSDSESDDEVPLAELAEKNKPTLQDKAITLPADKQAFDDVFGVSSPATNEPTPQTDAAPQPPADSGAHDTLDVFLQSTSPFETSLTGDSSNTATVSAPNDSTGISAFDEALKLMPARNGVDASNPTSDGQQFSSGATFDEFFDFSPTSATTAPPPSDATAANPLFVADANGFSHPAHTDDTHDLFSVPKLPPLASEGTKSLSFEEAFSAPKPPPSAPQGTKSLSFEEAFSTPKPPPSAPQGTKSLSFAEAFSAPQLPPLAPEGTKSISFEEVFSGFEPGPSADMGTSSSQVATPPTVKLESTSKPFPSATTPTSPQQDKSSQRGSSGYSETSFRSPSPTPQRAKSPPPQRVASPKPRPSTSSSKDDKPHNIPTRHSKISIRLPFGKKKKKQQQQQQQQQPETQQPPLPQTQQHLSAPREHVGLNRSFTPVGDDDDVQPVKHLISMGFNRAQVIDALERNGYDVQKALDALLGSH